MITKSDRLLMRLAYLNQVYKSDFIMLTYDYNNNGSRIARSLLESGLINERGVPKSTGQGVTKVISITRKGRKYLTDKFDDHVFTKSARDIQRPWNTGDPKKLNKRLLQNRLRVMMFIADALSLEYEKPSLTALYYDRYGREYDPTDDEYLYDNDLDYSTVLDSGVYYDFTEINRAIGKLTGPSGQDSIKQSRIRGVFLSKDKTVFCYTANQYYNRPVKISSTSEHRAVNYLMGFFSKINGVHSQEAIVLGTGDSLVDKMCKKDHLKESKIGELISWETPLYDHIYVIPHSVDGNISLYTALHNDYEGWRDLSYALFENLGFITPIREHIGNPFFIGENKRNRHRVIYLPYHDVKLLNLIKGFHDDIDIIAPAEMINTIANIIDRDNVYYDLDGNEVTPAMKVPTMLDEPKKRIEHYKSFSVSIEKEQYAKLKFISKVTCKGMSSMVRKAINQFIDESYDEAVRIEAEEKELRKKMRQ